MLDGCLLELGVIPTIVILQYRKFGQRKSPRHSLLVAAVDRNVRLSSKLWKRRAQVVNGEHRRIAFRLLEGDSLQGRKHFVFVTIAG